MRLRSPGAALRRNQDFIRYPSLQISLSKIEAFSTMPYRSARPHLTSHS